MQEKKQKQKQYKLKEGKERAIFVLSKNQIKKLKESSKKHGLTMSDIVRRLIDANL